jgi:hypothetical protein
MSKSILLALALLMSGGIAFAQTSSIVTPPSPLDKSLTPAPPVIAPVSPVARALIPIPPTPPTPVVVPDPGTNFGAFAAAVMVAATSRQWGTLLALLLIGAVWAIRKWAPVAFFQTDRGGALLSIVGGLGLAIAAAAAAPGSHSLAQVAITGLLMAITASGSYALYRKLIDPSDSNSNPNP